MTLSKFKKVFIAMVIFIFAASFVVSSYMISAGMTGVNVYAETDTATGMDDCIDSSKQELERMISATREEYSDLVEYTYSEEIEAELDNLGMTVGESLVNLIYHYQERLVETSDEDEALKISNLIDGTKNILNTYEDIARKTQNASEYPIAAVSDYIIIPGFGPIKSELYAVFSTIVALAVSYFADVNYMLSAELLTRAWFENYIEDDPYYPVYGNRITGSQETYSFINSDETASWIEYTIRAPLITNTWTCYEEDLGFALHTCKITRSSVDSMSVQVTDTYDFDITDSGNVILDDLVNIFAYAQICGAIASYEVIINVDMADPLYLQLVSSSDDAHRISVKNYSDKDITVVYNSKMCFESDALDWTGLSDLALVTIGAGKTVTVTIEKNLLATHITFCYIRNGCKIITYADELYTDRDILNTTYTRTPHTIASDDMSIVTKGNGIWVVQLTNTYGEDVTLKYNTTMCFESDAKNWTGLTNVESVTLSSGKSTIVFISEYGFATTIATCFVTSNHNYYVYANNLYEYGSMTIKRTSVMTVVTYLTLSNLGKSNGSWSIKITNPLNQAVTVEYNTKMCFTDDAKNWSGLSDIGTVTIAANSSATVSISTNWFATAIAVSYELEGYRIISYANELDTSGGMQVYYNNFVIDES